MKAAADDYQEKKFPLLIKIFGVLCIVLGAVLVPLLVLIGIALVYLLMSGEYGSGTSTATLVIRLCEFGISTVMSVMFFILGVRLLRNHRHKTATIAYTMAGIEVLDLLCVVMLYGLDVRLIDPLVTLVFLVILSSRADPSLAQERELQRHLRDMETREQAQAGTLGRDETGKGYITLNFLNLFWIFTVCCILGLLIETVYHAVVFGGYQDRAGLLYGPFSPIYGFGGMLMTMALNRFHDKNLVLIFLVSAVIGGAFEYATSWFMQFSFGITAWDYTGTFLSIDGRTNGMFMAMWGVLGIVWIKMFLPLILDLVNRIPLNWRYSVTSICAALMILDGGLTLASLDCWYQRLVGTPPESALDYFCAEHYDNDFMQNRFQSMTIDPSAATRVE